jgi:iron(III) transport system ATP-binding protein
MPENGNATMDGVIAITDLNKTFVANGREVAAFRDINLQVQDGEFLVLLGPSGSGKTTLLRCVAGLETPDSGKILLNGRLVFSGDGGVCVPPEERELGMVFQSYAIWPHMTVYENVALPLRRGCAKIPKEQVADRVRNALTQVGMEGMADRPAPQLSGGQQQRVALARSLALQPKVLLMDEPLSNLDARLREEVRAEVRDLVHRIGVTVLYVTHDQAEAMDLADRIVVLHQGRVLQVGRAEDLYIRPNCPEVAQFLGSMNWFKGVVSADGKVDTPIGEFAIDYGNVPKGGRLTLGVRPEFIRVAPASSDGAAADMADCLTIPGTVAGATFFGDHRLYRINAGQQTFTARVPLANPLSGTVCLHIPIDRLCIFPGGHQEGEPAASVV